MRAALAVAALVACAACGSTVQSTSTAAVGGGLGPGSTVVPATSGAHGASGQRPGAPTTDTTMPSQLSPTAPAAAATAAGAPVAARPGTTMPGVTATTMTIGVLAADPSTDKTLGNAGLGAAEIGNEPAAWQAVADDVNAHGGIAGRRVKLVFYLVNLTDPPASQGAAACARFTEDTTVAVVLSGYYYSSADTCLAKKGVPALLGTNYGVDRQQQRQSSTVIAWATPLLDRLAAALPPAFQRMGRLKPGTTAGIFVTDAPAFTRAAEVLGSELASRGVKVVVQTVKDSDSGDYGAAASDGSSAVLKFRSAGVTEVLFLTHNAFEPTVLMQAANSQGYHPTYLLSSQQYPAQLAGLVPAGQLDGALAIGWGPTVDLASGYATSLRARQCLATLAKHGVKPSTGAQTAVGLLACDGVDLLQRAAQAPGGVTSRAVLSANAVSSSLGFVSAFTIRTAFDGGRHDGVASYRPMSFSSSCTCFSYTGPITTM